MNNSLLPVPKRLVGNLLKRFLPEYYTGDDKLELIIRLKGKDISVRQLAAYLTFLDKAYGRLTPKGIAHYARTTKYELRVSEIRHGSIEIVIANLLSDPESIKALIIVGLLLKFMSGTIKSVLSSYRDYEEGRLARARRQQIKEQIKQDKRLAELPDRQVNQLCHLLDLMYGRDIRNLPKAHKFSKETVIEVEFELQKHKDSLAEKERIRKIRIRQKSDIE